MAYQCIPLPVGMVGTLVRATACAIPTAIWRRKISPLDKATTANGRIMEADMEGADILCRAGMGRISMSETANVIPRAPYRFDFRTDPTAIIGTKSRARLGRSAVLFLVGLG